MLFVDERFVKCYLVAILIVLCQELVYHKKYKLFKNGMIAPEMMLHSG